MCEGVAARLGHRRHGLFQQILADTQRKSVAGGAG
jgi:hypothetical protein